MGGSRRRLKKSRPKVKVGLPKVKPNVFKPSFSVPAKLRSLTSAEWDDKASVIKNYRSFGVVSNPNLLGANYRFNWAVQDPSLQLPQKLPKPMEGVASEFQPLDSGSDLEEDDLKDALRKKRKDGKKTPMQRLTTMQRVYVSRMILKHGNDYQAMSKDRKLNAMQHPPAKLQKLCERFHAYDKLENTEKQS